MIKRHIWGVIPYGTSQAGEAALESALQAATAADGASAHPRVRAADAASYAAARGLKLSLVTEEELRRGRLEGQAVDGFILFEQGRTVGHPHLEEGEPDGLLHLLSERFPGVPVIRSAPAKDEKESVAVRLAYWPSRAIFDL